VKTIHATFKEKDREEVATKMRFFAKIAGVTFSLVTFLPS